MKIKGIDVSHWQGRIDWKKVKKAGINFAILKAGGSDNGFYTDSKFEEYYKGAKNAGIPVGAYYFVGKNFKGRANGVADAKKFLAIIKGKKFEYPVYLDLEATPTSARESATLAAIGFCETLENAGYYTGIYASDISGWKERLVKNKLSAYDAWVARYGREPKYQTVYGLWQYSENGRVSGISGNSVDLDYAVMDYPKIIINAHKNGY